MKRERECVDFYGMLRVYFLIEIYTITVCSLQFPSIYLQGKDRLSAVGQQALQTYRFRFG